MIKRLIVVAVVLVVIIIAIGFMGNGFEPNGRSDTDLPDYPIQLVEIRNEPYRLLVPRNEAERTIGLAAVPVLPDGHGMLFQGHGQIGIWMKDMRYSIDIIWLDGDDVVIHIEHSVQPDSYPQVFLNPAVTNARQVIELNSGEVKRIGLDIGQAVKFVDD